MHKPGKTIHRRPISKRGKPTLLFLGNPLALQPHRSVDRFLLLTHDSLRGSRFSGHSFGPSHSDVSPYSIHQSPHARPSGLDLPSKAQQCPNSGHQLQQQQLLCSEVRTLSMLRGNSDAHRENVILGALSSSCHILSEESLDTPVPVSGTISQIRETFGGRLDVSQIRVIQAFTPSFGKHSWNTLHEVPGTILHSGNTKVNRTVSGLKKLTNLSTGCNCCYSVAKSGTTLCDP